MIALLQRDLRLALRAGGGFGLGLAFFLMVAVLVPLGVGPEGALLARIAPGILWVGALLACLLSLDRMFALDFEDGALDLMAVSPLPLEGVVAMKALAHWLVTGLPLPDQHIDNALASPETVLSHEKFERIEAVFAGAGDTLTAALAALLATGMDLPEATSEALHYLDRCLDEGFRPGMGQVIPDRLFWALPDDEDTDAQEGPEVHPGADYFEVPFNETKH